MMLCGMATLSFAQEDAAWSNNPLTSDWNYPGNWLPLPLPSSGPLRVPTGLAAFSSSSTIQTITLSAPTTIQTLQFDAPGYTFDLSSTINFLKIAGSGIVAPLAANVPIFKLPDGSLHFINASTAGPASISVSGEGNVTFNFEDRTSANIANAGTATIIAGVAGSPGEPTEDTGGFVEFFGHSTADHATITAFVDFEH